MTIQQLQYILEVQRTGTIAQAAKNLYVSNSGVSNAINALETELGFAIFERSWQGVVPTKQGREVLEHARKICEHQQLILRTAQARKTVRIETGVGSPFGEVFVKLMEENRGRNDVVFCHQYTKNTGGHTSKSPEDRLAAFETDVFANILYESRAGNVNQLKRKAFQKRLALEVRMSLPAVVRIGPGHRLYHKLDIQLSDLAQDTMVDLPAGLVAASRMMVKYVGFTPENTLLAADKSTRYELVSKGQGYAVGPKLPNWLDEEYGFRNILIPELQYKVISITNPLQPLQPEAQRYLELLDEELKDIRIG